MAELQGAFSLDRITKSPAVFDKTKLSWVNGQHLRSLPEEDLLPLVASTWQESGLLAKSDSPFVRAALRVCQHSLEVRCMMMRIRLSSLFDSHRCLIALLD